MLGTDYMLRAAVAMLEKICEGKLRLDRTVEVSVTNIREKRHIMGVLQPNLATLEQLLARNQEDFLAAVSRSCPRKVRQAAWQRLVKPARPGGPPGRRDRPANATSADPVGQAPRGLRADGRARRQLHDLRRSGDRRRGSPRFARSCTI